MHLYEPIKKDCFTSCDPMYIPNRFHKPRIQCLVVILKINPPPHPLDNKLKENRKWSYANIIGFLGRSCNIAMILQAMKGKN